MTTPFIEHSVEDVINTIYIAAALVIIVVMVLFCFIYGAFYAITAPILIVAFVAPIALLAMIIIWALPEARSAPVKVLAPLLYAYWIANIMWPNYLGAMTTVYALLPTTVVLGDSFFDGYFRAGFDAYFNTLLRMRWSEIMLRNGDCSNCTAIPSRRTSSKAGSPVVFLRSARTIVSLSVSGAAWMRRLRSVSL